MSKCYDGMAYVNRYEFKVHTSYVILDSNQAKIVKEITPEKNVNESDSLKTEILQKLQQMPLTIFGSVVTKDLSQAKDFDVFLDLDTNPDYKKYLNSLLQLAQKYYGWLDPFVLKDGVLYTRKDDATGWVKAKNSAEILQKIRSTGKEINQI